MISFLKKYTSNIATNEAGILTLGTLVAQIIGILFTPVLSKIFTPGEYGNLALFTSVAVVVSSIVSLSYPIRIILPKDDEEAESLVFVSMLLTFILTLLFCIIAFFLPFSFFNNIGLLSISDWLIGAIVSGFTLAQITIATNWLNRHSEFKKLAKLKIIQAIIIPVLALFLAFSSYSDSLIRAQLFGLSLAAILYMIPFFNRNWSFSLSRSVVAAKKHIKAPIYLLPSSLLDVVTLQLPYVLIALWFGADATGQYRMAYGLLALPGSLISVGIGQVFYRQFSFLWPDALSAKVFLIQTWKLIAKLAFFPLIIVLLFGEQLFSFALGNTWGEAGVYASILAPMVFVSLIHSPTSVILISMGLEHRLLYFGFAVLVYRPITLYIGFYFHSIILGLILLATLEILQMLLFQITALRHLNNTIKGN